MGAVISWCLNLWPLAWWGGCKLITASAISMLSVSGLVRGWKSDLWSLVRKYKGMECKLPRPHFATKSGGTGRDFSVGCPVLEAMVDHLSPGLEQAFLWQTQNIRAPSAYLPAMITPPFSVAVSRGNRCHMGHSGRKVSKCIFVLVICLLVVVTETFCVPSTARTPSSCILVLYLGPC